MDECYAKVVGQAPAISTLKRKADLQIWSGSVRSPVPVVPGAWCPGVLLLPASLVVTLPPVLASLVVVSAFYAGSVVGVGRAA
jgi:hypothetical protein